MSTENDDQAGGDVPPVGRSRAKAGGGSQAGAGSEHAELARHSGTVNQEEDELRVEWAQAYITQARSDWSLFERLRGMPDVAACHHLHYLQMACEKLAKAYRFRDTNTLPSSLLTRHGGFAKFMSSFMRSPRVLEAFRGNTSRLRETRKAFNRIAREVEQLAPAVDRGNSPQNAEYPWRDGGRIIIPCEFGYSKLSLLRESGGRAFLKWVFLALEDFDDIRIS